MLWRRSLLTLVLAAGVWACAGQEAGPAGPGTPGAAAADVAGTWTYFEVMSNSALGVSCKDQGTLDISQSGSNFSATANQTGSCTGPAGLADNSGAGNIANGAVSTSSIGFDVAGCHYQGSLFSTPADSAAGSLSCALMEAGQTATLTGTWFAVKGLDLAPPSVAGTLVAPQGDTLFVPADTFQVTVTASGGRRLLWAGYRLGSPANVQDSAPVVKSSFTGPFRLVVPSSWAGRSSLTVFARDALSRLTEAPVRAVQVLNAIRRPTRSVQLGVAYIPDLAFDARRNVIYLSEPDSLRIAVLSFDALTFNAPISMPSRSAGIDLSLSGDSLLIALRRTVYLGIVDLTQAIRRVDTIRLNFDTSYGRGPDNLRIAANDKILISLSFDGVGYGGRVMDYDLATKTQGVRSDVGTPFGQVVETVPLSPVAGRSRIFALPQCCPGQAQIYVAATDVFSSPMPAGDVAIPPPSVDAAGTRYLIGNKLYDATLNLVVTFTPPEYANGFYGLPPTVIALDASVAYFGTDYGYIKLQVSDGAVLERVRLLSAPHHLSVLPDGKTLIARDDFWAYGNTSTRMFVVDLR